MTDEITADGLREMRDTLKKNYNRDGGKIYVKQCDVCKLVDLSLTREWTCPCCRSPLEMIEQHL